MSTGMGQERRDLARLDQDAFAAVARWRNPLLDRIMPALTRVADHSVLWMLVAAGLSALPSRRAKAAARRGVTSLGAASLVANQLGKRTVHRDRPDVELVPLARRAWRRPTSNSFPSGHSASAAAFALGVALEAPTELAVPVATVAAGVAFSRVYTGAHYPGDVIVGVALGAAVAGAGAVLVPPERLRHPADPPRILDVEPRPTGHGTAIVINPSAGSVTVQALVARVNRLLPDASVHVLGRDENLLTALRHAADDADVLGVAGGDGSLNAAAGIALERGLPLLALPAGTLNHFARDVGLDGPEDAIAALREGTQVHVDVGRVADRIFLNTASLGSYPSFVRVREKWQDRIGKPLAALVATHEVMHHDDPLRAVVDGTPRAVAALFVGAGRYDPPGMLPERRRRMDSGVLDVRYLDVAGATSRRQALSMVLDRTRLASASVRVHETTFTVEVDAPTLLARDGEIGRVEAGELVFRIDPTALPVYRPRPS